VWIISPSKVARSSWVQSAKYIIPLYILFPINVVKNSKLVDYHYHLLTSVDKWWCQAKFPVFFLWHTYMVIFFLPSASVSPLALLWKGFYACSTAVSVFVAVGDNSSGCLAAPCDQFPVWVDGVHIGVSTT